MGFSSTNVRAFFGYHLGPDLIVLGVFLALLAGVMVAYGAHPTFAESSILLPLAVMVVLIAAGLFSRARNTLAILRDWCPMILLVLVYENFRELTHLIRPQAVDGTLRALDEKLLGIAPALALQPLIRPWLTELMTVAYGLYFLYPALILGIFYKRGQFIRFRELGLALSMAFYLGLLGYMLVPAVGPRFFMAGEFRVPLTGIWLTERAAAAWNAIESVQRDCFPSLHTALSTISLVYLVRHGRAWPGGKLLLAACTPLIVLLWASTIYLRYHYFVDVVAGFVLAAFSSAAAPAFIRWYYARKARRSPAPQPA